MKSNRLSVALHVLAHLAERRGEPATSEHLAACVDTNPVVIRRTLAGLRDAGFVASSGGRGGGWRLTREPSEIPLGEVCAALGERLLFAAAFGGGGASCRVEAAVSGVLDGFLEEAEAHLLARLDTLSLADVTGRIPHPHRHG